MGIAGSDRAALARSAIERIDRWLTEHAPHAHATLRPPASAVDIADLEAELGRPIPTDLRAWWTYADGIDLRSPNLPDLIPPYFWPISTERSRQERRQLMTLADLVIPADVDAVIAEQSALPAGTPSLAWLPHWLPIAIDFSRGRLFVDLREGNQHGCVTQFLSDAGSFQRPEWADVAAMLFDIAERLGEEEASVETDGRLRWSSA
jgi:cell wall assembly regulator SMI1